MNDVPRVKRVVQVGHRSTPGSALARLVKISEGNISKLLAKMIGITPA